MSAADEIQVQREVRAARNQAMFRMVNERLREATELLEAADDPLTIACECADVGCIQTLQISREHYEAVRGQARRFAVLPGHVYPEVEWVVTENDGYVVVEKVADAGRVAEALDPRGA